MSRLIRVNGAAELLAVVSHRLGFQPQNSLVLVSLRKQGRMGLVLRADLDAAPGSIARLTAHVQDDGAQRTVTIVYSDDNQRAADILAHAPTWTDEIEHFRDAAHRAASSTSLRIVTQVDGSRRGEYDWVTDLVFEGPADDDLRWRVVLEPNPDLTTPAFAR